MKIKAHFHKHKDQSVPMSVSIITLAVVTMIAIIIPLIIFAQEFLPETKKEFYRAAQIDGTPVDAGEAEIEEPPEEKVDPQQIKDALRDLRDINSELKRFSKAANKIKTEEGKKILEEISQVQVEINRFTTDIKKPQSDSTLNETLRDFGDARLWDSLNPIRAKIELPEELKQIDRDLKQLEKMAKKGREVKLPGVDIEVFNKNLSELRNAYNEAKTKLAEGDFETAMEAMEEFHHGRHPGNIFGFLEMYRETYRNLKRIKDANIKNIILEILDPIIADFNSGEFEDARIAMEDFGREMDKISRKFKFDSRNADFANPELEGKLEKLEQLINDKLNTSNQGESEKGAENNEGG